ncbi:MAG: hypothetical protein IKQ18_09370 [Clostridia bacterium]|nr:hypothetical protein [Clostridia bacterium]
MELKYSLKDVLLEAGVRDYRQIETDKGWEPSGTHTRIMEKIYKKEKSKKEKTGIPPFVKTMYGVAAAALLVCLALAIKPVREGIASMFGINQNTPPAAVTTDNATEKPPVTETETDTDAVTETETDPETTRPEPVTDEEKIAAITDGIAENGYTEELWSQLRGYADKAFIYCFDTYFNTDCDNKHKMVFSVFCSQYLAPELTEYATDFKFKAFKLSLTADDIKPANVTGLSIWLARFREEIEEYMTCYRREEEAYKNLYFTDLMLNRLDYVYYRAGSPDTPPEEYDPKRCLLSENIEYLKVHGLKTYNSSFQIAIFNTENHIERLLDMYDRERDVKRKAVISTLIALFIQVYDSEDATQGGRMTLSDFFGDDYAYLTSINGEEIKKLDASADLTFYAHWLKNFIPMLEKAASKVPEHTVLQDRDVCYSILRHVGFDGYYVEGEFEKEVEEALSAFIRLSAGTFTGGFKSDEIDKIYSSVEGAENPLPEALIEKLNKYLKYDYNVYVKDGYVFTYSTAKDEDLRTIDGWRKKMYGLLEDKELADGILANENEDYIILDGVIYLSNGPWEGGYYIYVSVNPGSVRTIGETDEYVTVTADIRWSKYKAETHTFYIRKTEDGLKIATLGSFFDKYLKNGTIDPYSN